MSYDEMLSWSPFYTTLFDMKKPPMVDVVDPDGLVRCQALETPHGAFRITLNDAETGRTMPGNILADSFGASVQHIVLAKRDFKPLPMSDNVYADLVARCDLAPDLLAALKAGNILCDQDANGTFCQFYSRPYAGWIFFEAVQWAGGYTGYCAPNAPFRIAARSASCAQK